jgi:hypothetical protein
MKKLVIVLLLLVAVIVVAYRSGNQQPARTSFPAAADHSSHDSHAQISNQQFAATGRVPAYFETAPDISTLPPTLSPNLFTGNKRLAYQAAKEIPETLAQLPCYCHCDRGHGHKSLHSCFESEHGENCGICIGEALMAHNLQKRGMKVAEIRQQIIAAYGQAETE